MNKQDILSEIKSHLATGVISEEDVRELLTGASAPQETQSSGTISMKRSVDMGKVLSYVGGFIIFLGVVVLVGQNWDTLGVWGRILVTFGSGIVAYALGVVWGIYPKLNIVSQVCYAISMFLLPGGLVLTMLELGSWEPLTMNVFVATLLMALFIFTFWVVRQTHITLVASVAFSTWFVYAAVIYFLDFGQFWSTGEDRILAYLTMLVGVAYVSGAWYLSETQWSKLSSALYALGAIGVLMPALLLGGIWDILFVGVVAGVFVGSVYVKSRAFLFFGALHLMGYIIKMTAEYFDNIVYWPIALIIVGCALIGVGYMTYRLSGYMSETNTQM